MLTLNQSFEHDGRRIAWGRIGEGEPLVLIHGWPFSSQVWRRIAPWLARGRSVFFFDLPGMGASEKAAAVDPASHDPVLAALLGHWGLERPEIVAHDFGGLAALRGHFLGGLQYRRLTLIDPVAVLPSGSPFFRHVREHEAAFAGLPAYAHEALFQAYIQQAAARPLSAEAREIYAAPFRGEAGQAAFYRYIAQTDEAYVAELERRYGRPPFPVRLVWGAEDSFIPPSFGERLAGLIGAAPPLLVPGAAHLVQEDAPEAILAALLGPSGA
ncbi:Pimeloyl-ACP methyl ester carboxylesterase [Tistlia consotensis]|uniref:Pimeloyl-ACP methyl ester carboxylesterase n=1 Tax=Tistlia consotensis USBA 355 TaxID=560819 RepID=A0A1Y6C8F0_9PROT|nr:alpha/beta hydrolase [Tistlia consotensis]SMF47643.1 Pimeloyl-ACP methyl ester carboxylesterase [Tistlia consotensis USBA 355]SNR82254.1 Pimeloyl-ACP methyl ester carboxylesterase [Tistlia consotensis]